MSNSGRKINYSVRPAKNVERKMMRDFFLRLSHFGRIEDYRYIGFGSKYFSDFIIFHRHLNISEMISIEADTNNRARYEFNKPYSNIRMEWGHSSEVLPKLAQSAKKTGTRVHVGRIPDCNRENPELPKGHPYRTC